MTCREFADFMAEYLADELPASRREEFDRHLSVCANCSRYLDHYRQTLAMTQRAFEAPDAPVPEHVPEDLINAILRTRRSSTD